MSDKFVKFYLNQAGARQRILLHNDKVRDLEYEHMQRLLSEIEANFFQTFGFNGSFELLYKPTRFRTAYRISAADARTGAVLKSNPKWLDQFTREKLSS